MAVREGTMVAIRQWSVNLDETPRVMLVRAGGFPVLRVSGRRTAGAGLLYGCVRPCGMRHPHGFWIMPKSPAPRFSDQLLWRARLRCAGLASGGVPLSSRRRHRPDRVSPWRCGESNAARDMGVRQIAHDGSRFTPVRHPDPRRPRFQADRHVGGVTEREPAETAVQVFAPEFEALRASDQGRLEQAGFAPVQQRHVAGPVMSRCR